MPSLTANLLGPPATCPSTRWLLRRLLELCTSSRLLLEPQFQKKPEKWRGRQNKYCYFIVLFFFFFPRHGLCMLMRQGPPLKRGPKRGTGGKEESSLLPVYKLTPKKSPSSQPKNIEPHSIPLGRAGVDMDNPYFALSQTLLSTVWRVA